MDEPLGPDSYDIGSIAKKIERARLVGDLEALAEGFLFVESARSAYEAADCSIPAELKRLNEEHAALKNDPVYCEFFKTAIGSLHEVERDLRALRVSEQRVCFYENGAYLGTKLVETAVVPGVQKVASDPITIDCHFVGDSIRLELSKESSEVRALYDGALKQAQSDAQVVARLQELYEDD